MRKFLLLSAFFVFFSPCYAGAQSVFVCNGNSSDAAGIASAVNALSPPTDNVLTVLGKCSISSQITLTGKRNPTIRGRNRVSNFGGGNSTTLEWTGTGGTLFKLDSNQGVTIENFYFGLANGATIDKFIDIDGSGAGNPNTISTSNRVIFNSFNGSGQSNPNFKALSISAVSQVNNENMEISNNDFICSGGIGSSATGIGIHNGPNPNAKHQRFYNNTISRCSVGILSDNGSFDVLHYGGGSNGTDIKVTSGTEPIKIAFLETENSKVGVDLAISATVYHLSNCRFSNSNQTNAGGFLKLNGLVTIENSVVESVPPVGGVIFKDAGMGNLSLWLKGNRYKYGTGLTMAQLGLDAILKSAALNVTGEYFILGAPAATFSNQSATRVVSRQSDVTATASSSAILSTSSSGGHLVGFSGEAGHDPNDIAYGLPASITGLQGKLTESAQGTEKVAVRATFSGTMGQTNEAKVYGFKMDAFTQGSIGFNNNDAYGVSIPALKQPNIRTGYAFYQVGADDLNIFKGKTFLDLPILKSANGSCFRLSVGDSGTLSTTSVVCQ